MSMYNAAAADTGQPNISLATTQNATAGQQMSGGQTKPENTTQNTSNTPAAPKKPTAPAPPTQAASNIPMAPAAQLLYEMLGGGPL